MKKATANPSTVQANTELVAAISGKKIRVFGWFISSDVQQTVTLEGASNATEIRFYVGARGGMIHNPDQGVDKVPMIDLADNVALDFSTSAATGNTFIAVWYEQA